DLEVGIVYCPETAGAQSAAASIIEAIRSFQEKTVSGRRVKTSLIEYRGKDALQGAVSRGRLKALFILPGCPASACAEITRVTRKAGILSAGASQEQAGACGIALSIVREGSRPKVVLNLKAGAAEGKAFSGKLIRISELAGQ
ncbi:MAG: hypothetical protein JW832_06740, partial [Deltaproteobacteria bacterium]|nr:hypothetical protein [Deltaproteobacteria bacterium]